MNSRELVLILALVPLGCARGSAVEHTRVVPTTQMLDEQCAEAVGERRIERVELGEGVSLHIAIGYDLANTIVLHTPAGNVVVDAMSGPERAADLLPARERGPGREPGPVPRRDRRPPTA